MYGMGRKDEKSKDYPLKLLESGERHEILQYEKRRIANET